MIIKDLSDWFMAGHTAAEFRSLLQEADSGVEPAQGRILPEISIDIKDLRAISDAGWAALTEANIPPQLFRRGGALVRLNTDDDGSRVLADLNEAGLSHALARAADWTKKGNRAYPDLRVVKDMLASPNVPMPVLNRICGAPFFAADRQLVTEPGYHIGARSYYAPPAGFILAKVPARPARSDLKRAFDLLINDLFANFPFVGDAERAHAVALYLLPYVRDLIDGPTPFHLVEAPTAGMGKGLLLDVTSIVALGRPTAALTQGNQDEWRKAITAKLIEGGSVIVFDNLSGMIDSVALTSALTGMFWSDRLLSQNRTVSIPVRAVWAGTGNNVRLSQDLSRRTIRIRLDAKMDRPWMRKKFKHENLREWATLNRADLVWAALVMVQAWIADGVRYTGPVLGSYERWAAVMGAILEANEIPGFLDNLPEFYDEADTEGSALRALVEKWWAVHAEKKVSAAALWGIAATLEETLDLGPGGDRSQRTKFGQLLVNLRDRQFGGLRVIAAGAIQGAKVWRLVKVEEEG